MEMKKKMAAALLMAAVMVLGTVSAFALDYYVPEDAREVTARFISAGVFEGFDPDSSFSMVSEDGETTIHINDDVIIYFEDFVPLSDECDDVTQMVREVLFGRTLMEVLDGRNMRVIFGEDEAVPISIKVLFEVAVHLPIELSTEDLAGLENEDYPIGYDEPTYGEAVFGGYEGIVTLPGVISPEDIDYSDYMGFIPPIGELDHDVFFGPVEYAALNGEIVVEGEILENAPLPFWCETGRTFMVPLRVVAEALGYDVTWNGYTQSIQLGVGVSLRIGQTEMHRGRMAPIELSAAPVLIDNLTFVPIDFFRMLGKTVYVFEGQVVVETYSDMR